MKKKNSLWFVAAAMTAILTGCTADTTDGDDPSPAETQAPPVSTSRSVEPTTTCIPQKMPICGEYVCSGTGTCRRCSCLY
jgi:hypothetical protein